MVKITEEQCHISQGTSDASFSRALKENNQADSTSGLDKYVLWMHETPQL